VYLDFFGGGKGLVVEQFAEFSFCRDRIRFGIVRSKRLEKLSISPLLEVIVRPLSSDHVERVDVLVSSMDKFFNSISVVVDDEDNGTESMPNHGTDFLIRQIREIRLLT